MDRVDIMKRRAAVRAAASAQGAGKMAWFRAFRMLEAVASSPVPLGLEKIALSVGIPKPTVHRLLVEMVEQGVLLRDSSSKAFTLGRRASDLSIAALLNASWRTERHAILEGLVARIGETCNLTALDGTSVRYVDRVEADWPLRLVLKPGSRVPLHCTSSGKLFLAHMPVRLRKHLIFDTPIERFTAKTITDPKALERECLRIRRQGHATDDGGFLAGLISVAVPVIRRQDRVIIAVAVHAPAARLPLKKALECLPLLKRAAGRLARLYEQNAAS